MRNEGGTYAQVTLDTLCFLRNYYRKTIALAASSESYQTIRHVVLTLTVLCDAF